MTDPTRPRKAAETTDISPVDVHQLISQVTQGLGSAVIVRESNEGIKPLTFAEVVRTGAMFCKIMASLDPQGGGRFSEEEQELVQEIRAKVSDPDALNVMFRTRE